MQQAINFIEEQLLNQPDKDGLIVYKDYDWLNSQFMYYLHKHLLNFGYNISLTTVNPPFMQFLNLSHPIPDGLDGSTTEQRLFLVQADKIEQFDGIRNEPIHWVCKLGRISEFSDIFIHSLLRQKKSEQEKYIGSFCKESGSSKGN